MLSPLLLPKIFEQYLQLFVREREVEKGRFQLLLLPIILPLQQHFPLPKMANGTHHGEILYLSMCSRITHLFCPSQIVTTMRRSSLFCWYHLLVAAMAVLVVVEEEWPRKLLPVHDAAERGEGRFWHILACYFSLSIFRFSAFGLALFGAVVSLFTNKFSSILILPFVVMHWT